MKSELYPFGEFSHFVVHRLPEYNRKGDFQKGVSFLKNLLPSYDEIFEVIYDQPFSTRIRAMGDLGISLVVSELGKSPISSDVINRLKVLTTSIGMVPRDTYSSYINYNPTEALRTFTGDESEIHFIQQLQKSNQAIQPAAEHLLLLQTDPFRDDRMELLKSVRVCIKKLKDENRAVHKAVDPKFFFNEFRKYFFPIQIDGQEYGAPSAVHLANLIIIDVIMGIPNQSHLQIIQGLFPYFEPVDKFRVNQALSHTSLKEHYKNKNEAILMDEVYKSLLEYRQTHQSLVTRYIRKQDPEIKHGTGGFAFDSFLQGLIEMTQISRQSLKE